MIPVGGMLYPAADGDPALTEQVYRVGPGCYELRRWERGSCRVTPMTAAEACDCYPHATFMGQDVRAVMRERIEMLEGVRIEPRCHSTRGDA